jgi:hypothetical protein
MSLASGMLTSEPVVSLPMLDKAPLNLQILVQQNLAAAHAAAHHAEHAIKFKIVVSQSFAICYTDCLVLDLVQFLIFLTCDYVPNFHFVAKLTSDVKQIIKIA